MISSYLFAQSPPKLDPEQAKAGVTLNLARYLIWPNDSRSPTQNLTIGIQSPTDAWYLLEKTKVNGLPVKVLQVTRASDATGCHIIFLRSTGSLKPSDFTNIQETIVVIMAEDLDSLERGAHFAIAIEDGKPVFSAHLKALRALQIQVSSQALKLAKKVIQ